MSTDERAWVADPGIAWRILLVARPVAMPAREDVVAALQQLRRDQAWADDPELVLGPDAATMRAELAVRPGRALLVGLSPERMVVSAHHSLVDGQGLLAVLGALIGADVHSTARGVDDRPAAGFAGSVARRLAEVALRPPARIAGAGGEPDQTGEAFARRDVAGRFSTTDLVAAVSPALGRRRHVAVAVGVARLPGPDDDGRIRDRSALIRLRDVERLDAGDIRGALRTAPLEAAGGGAGAGGAVMRAGLRLLAPRLGSTLLVSHLGRLADDAPVLDCALHPVTAGGTGLALGAVTVGDRTSLTLRGRRRTWSDEGLERLLETLVSELVRR